MDSNDYIEFEGVRRYQPDALHKRMAACIAELEAQLQALGVVVDGQNRKLKVLLAAAAARGDGFGPVPANPTDGMSYMQRQALLDTDINEV